MKNFQMAVKDSCCYLEKESSAGGRSFLGEARLLRGHVAPLLDDGLLDGSGVGSGPGAGLLGGVLDNGLLLVITGLGTRLESTAGGGTELPGLLGTSGLGGILLDLLLGDAADLPGPLGALGVGGVSGSLILALLLNLSSALNDVILDIMDLLGSPALGLVLSAADLGSLNVAILDQRSSADLDSLVEGNLLVLDETALSEVLLALLLLLGVVVGDVGGVASLVVAMVALDHVIVLNLLDHFDLVNASLAIGSGGGSGDISEAGGGIRGSLTLGSGSQILGRSPGGVVFVVVSMMVMMITMTLSIGVEGEG